VAQLLLQLLTLEEQVQKTKDELEGHPPKGDLAVIQKYADEF
jgi:hypothetical protein